jgi:hypothetical protein
MTPCISGHLLWLLPSLIYPSSSTASFAGLLEGSIVPHGPKHRLDWRASSAFWEDVRRSSITSTFILGLNAYWQPYETRMQALIRHTGIIVVLLVCSLIVSCIKKRIQAYIEHSADDNKSRTLWRWSLCLLDWTVLSLALLHAPLHVGFLIVLVYALLRMISLHICPSR